MKVHLILLSPKAGKQLNEKHLWNWSACPTTYALGWWHCSHAPTPTLKACISDSQFQTCTKRELISTISTGRKLQISFLVYSRNGLGNTIFPRLYINFHGPFFLSFHWHSLPGWIVFPLPKTFGKSIFPILKGLESQSFPYWNVWKVNLSHAETFGKSIFPILKCLESQSFPCWNVWKVTWIDSLPC